MVRRGDDVLVIWPRYFDVRRSRAEGRRVPKDLAVRDPDAKWVLAAAAKAGLQADLEEGKRDPFRPWKGAGRVVVRGKGDKEAKLRAIGEKMVEAKA